MRFTDEPHNLRPKEPPPRRARLQIKKDSRFSDHGGSGRSGAPSELKGFWGDIFGRAVVIFLYRNARTPQSGAGTGGALPHQMGCTRIPASSQLLRGIAAPTHPPSVPACPRSPPCCASSHTPSMNRPHCPPRCCRDPPIIPCSGFNFPAQEGFQLSGLYRALLAEASPSCGSIITSGLEVGGAGADSRCRVSGQSVAMLCPIDALR